MPRGGPEQAESDLRGFGSHFERGDGAQRAAEGFRRGADQLAPVESRFEHSPLDQALLPGARADDDGVATVRRHVPQPVQTGFLVPLGIGGGSRAGQNHEVRPYRRRRTAVGRDRRSEALDRPRLLDVERLACRNIAGIVDQPDFPIQVERGRHVGKCAAQRSGADDGDDRHR